MSEPIASSSKKPQFLSASQESLPSQTQNNLKPVRSYESSHKLKSRLKKRNSIGDYRDKYNNSLAALLNKNSSESTEKSLHKSKYYTPSFRDTEKYYPDITKTNIFSEPPHSPDNIKEFPLENKSFKPNNLELISLEKVSSLKKTTSVSQLKKMFENEEPSPGLSNALMQVIESEKEDLNFYGSKIDKDCPVIMVSNCSNGEVGHYIARHFALKKCRIVCIAPQLELLSELQGDKFDKIAANLQVPKALDQVISYIQAKYPCIDIVMIPPSVDALGPAIELGRSDNQDLDAQGSSEDVASMVYSANVLAPLSLAQRVARLMMANNIKGTISFVGSILGDVPTPWNALFSSSMAALHSLANSLRLEVSPYQIRVLLFKMGYDKSMVINNNLHNLQSPYNSAYKSVENHVAYRAVWNRQEIESRGKVFASVAVHTTLNRHHGAHYILELALSPYKAFFSWGSRMASWAVPELTPHLNFFSPSNNPNWPCSKWVYDIGGDSVMKLFFYRSASHSVFLDWFRWDWLGLGYVSYDSNKLIELPKTNLIQNTNCEVWSPPGCSEDRTLFSNDGSNYPH